ncbi:MAG TPA: DUF29 family protein [Candidatus Solibacter sp.]|nr:DUF29 family protein [Candidatus Solibacter sp.]
MAVTTKTRYDIDFFEWTKERAELVRARRLDEVDIDHVAEGIESLGSCDRRAFATHFEATGYHQSYWYPASRSSAIVAATL